MNIKNFFYSLSPQKVEEHVALFVIARRATTTAPIFWPYFYLLSAPYHIARGSEDCGVCSFIANSNANSFTVRNSPGGACPEPPRRVGVGIRGRRPHEKVAHMLRPHVSPIHEFIRLGFICLQMY